MSDVAEEATAEQRAMFETSKVQVFDLCDKLMDGWRKFADKPWTLTMGGKPGSTLEEMVEQYRQALLNTQKSGDMDDVPTHIVIATVDEIIAASPGQTPLVPVKTIFSTGPTKSGRERAAWITGVSNVLPFLVAMTKVALGEDTDLTELADDRDQANARLEQVQAITAYREKILAEGGEDVEIISETSVENDNSGRRDEVARILEIIAKDGLPGPRDLDVALDAIEASYGITP